MSPIQTTLDIEFSDNPDWNEIAHLEWSRWVEKLKPWIHFPKSISSTFSTMNGPSQLQPFNNTYLDLIQEHFYLKYPTLSSFFQVHLAMSRPSNPVLVTGQQDQHINPFGISCTLQSWNTQLKGTSFRDFKWPKIYLVKETPSRDLIWAVLKYGGSRMWISSLAFLNTSNLPLAQVGIFEE